MLVCLCAGCECLVSELNSHLRFKKLDNCLKLKIEEIAHKNVNYLRKQVKVY